MSQTFEVTVKNSFKYAVFGYMKHFFIEIHTKMECICAVGKYVRKEQPERFEGTNITCIGSSYRNHEQELFLQITVVHPGCL